MVYPVLLPLMRTPRLPVVDRTDAPADLNGLVGFAERRNLVSARVPTHFKRNLPTGNGYLVGPRAGQKGRLISLTSAASRTTIPRLVKL
jgi:hypothetical protein